MAIYHFSVQIASRSAGKSAIAMAAYRSGERLIDERTGEIKQYRREEKPESMILAPDHAPDWVYDRQRLWNEVELIEKQKNAQLCREINIALPVELTNEQQRQLIADYCQREFVDRGMIADIAIHRDDPGNPHAHVMLTLREIKSNGTWAAKSKKEYVLDKNGEKIKLPSGHYKSNRVNLNDWDSDEVFNSWREQWATQTNRALQEAGREERIDHRSLAAQGIDRMPTVHEGPIVRQMERRGVQTERGELNRTIQEHNALVVDLRTYAQERKRLKEQAAKPKSLVQIDNERIQLSVRRNNVQVEIQERHLKISQIQALQNLKLERAKLAKQIEELRPENVWQRMTKKNGASIEAAEEQLSKLDSRIRSASRHTPPAQDIPTLQRDISGLRGVLEALDKAVQALDQERSRAQQEQYRQIANHKHQSKDRDLER